MAGLSRADDEGGGRLGTDEFPSDPGCLNSRPRCIKPT